MKKIIIILVCFLLFVACETKKIIKNRYTQIDPIACAGECINDLFQKSDGIFSKREIKNELIEFCKEKSLKFKCYKSNSWGVIFFEYEINPNEKEITYQYF